MRIVKICDEGVRIIKLCWSPLSPTNFIALASDGRLVFVDYTIRESRQIGMATPGITSFSWSPRGHSLACGCSGGAWSFLKSTW